MSNPSGKRIKKTTNLFFSGVIILTVANLIVKVIGLLFKIPIHDILGNEGMGYYNQAYSIYTVFHMISTSGLPIAVSILVSESRSKKQLMQIKRVFSVTVLLFFIIGIAGTLIMSLGAYPFARFVLEDFNDTFCIVAIAPMLLFICVSSALRGYFQGFQQMVPTAISELIEALCKLVLGIVFAQIAIDLGYNRPEDIHIVATFAIFGLTIGAALSMVYLWITKLLFKEKKYTEEFEITEYTDHVDNSSAILKRLLFIALPITLSASVMSVTNAIDAVMIKKLLISIGYVKNEATAIYGNYTTLAVSMFNLPPVLVYPISASIIPLLSVAKTQGDKNKVRNIMESSLRVSVLIGIPCAFGLAVLAMPILSLIFGYDESVVMATPLLRLLAPSTLFVCMLSVTNAILQACGQERKPVISLAIGAVVKLVSNFFLIREIGMYGTPISTFLCYLTVICINFAFVFKYANIVPNIMRVFVRPFICGIVCAVSAIGSYVVYAGFDVESFTISGFEFRNIVFGGLNFGGITHSGFVSPNMATLLAIITAAIVYAISIFVLKAVTTDDILLLPKGKKICAVLKKVHLVKD